MSVKWESVYSGCQVTAQKNTEAMIAVCLVFCLIPTLCLATCCMLVAPPEFPHRAPPRPPNVKYNLSCPAIERQWPDSGGVYIHFNDDDGYFVDTKHNSGSYNHTRIPFSPDNVPSTSANPTVSGNQKSVSVGMVLGIVAGLLALFLLILLSWICTRSKPVKCDTTKEKDEGTNISFLQKCRIDACNWKRPAVPAKMLRHLFKNSEKCDGIDSAASSESGYCEDIVDNQESTSPKTQVILRNRQPRPSNSQLIPVMDMTPDIIASAQVNLEELPKRWSMFGLLPSLKPVLLTPASQCEVSDVDKWKDGEGKLLGSGGCSNMVDQVPKKNTDKILMKALDNEYYKAPSYMEMNTRQQAKMQLAESEMNPPSYKPVMPKKSRIRIRSDGNQPEVEV